MDSTPLPVLSEASALVSIPEPAATAPILAAEADDLGDTIIVAVPSSNTAPDLPAPTRDVEAPSEATAGMEVEDRTPAAPAGYERQEGAEGDSIRAESETHSVVAPSMIEDDVPSATDVTYAANQSPEAEEIVAPASSSFEAALMNPDASVRYESDEDDNGQASQELAGDDVALAQAPHPFVIDEPQAESEAPATSRGSAEVKDAGRDTAIKIETADPADADAKAENGQDEGEIEESSSESESSSEDEDNAVPATSTRTDEDDMDEEELDTGPLRTKNEIVEVPVNPVDVDISPTEPIEKLGVIERVVGKTVIVKALTSGEYQVLDQDSILVFSDRSPFGRVYETLGPVQKPIYSVKFNTDSEASNYLSHINKEVFYVPRFSTFVFTAAIKALKGSDASNWNDEEVDENEQEFSDDDTEAEFKRRQKETRKRAAHINDPHQVNKNLDATQSPTMPRPSQPLPVPANAEPYSFADLAGQDTDFLDQLASQIPVPAPPSVLNVASAYINYDSNQDGDGDGDSRNEDGDDVKDTDKPSQSPIAVPRGAPRAPRSYDDEPYKPLARPTSLLMSHSPPFAKVRPNNEASVMGSRPAAEDLLFADRDSQSPPPSNGSRSPVMSRSGDSLTNSQKRRRRRKRKEERERHERDERRWDAEKARERGRDRDRANRQRHREEELRAREYLLQRDGRPGKTKSNSPAQSNAGPYQPSHLQELPQPMLQDLNTAAFLQQFPSLSPYFNGQAPAPQQPPQSHPPYGQQNFQNIAQRLPPGAHVNPAFLAQFASGMLQQQQQQQQPPRPLQQQYQPPPPPPPQQQLDPQPSYLALLQQQLQQQQQHVLQQQQAAQAPPPPVAPQSQNQYQNQTQGQLQQQLQAILQQMQMNARRQQQQQPSPTVSVPPERPPGPSPSSPQDAFAQAQYQLNLLGMLQGNQNQGQGHRHSGDPRDPRNR
ncbi:Gar1/Naf1 RNA binding region-domain-containing protein [Lipomyces starkeyi]